MASVRKAKALWLPLSLRRALLGAILGMTPWQRSSGQETEPGGALIRVLPGEYSDVVFVRELADGRVAVGDRGESRIVLIRPDIGKVEQIGRPGRGPGEFSRVFSAVLAGRDTLVMFDEGLGRWLVSDGARPSTMLNREAIGVELIPTALLGADSRGRLLLRGPRAIAPAEQVSADSMLVLSATFRGSTKADTITRLLRGWSRISAQGSPGERPTSIQIRFVPLALSEDALPFADGWIAVARVSPYRVDWRSPNGDWTFGNALPDREVRIDARERDFFRARQAARGLPSRIRDDAPWPAALPPFELGNMVEAPDGRLLVRRTPSASDSSTRYDVVDRRSQLVDRIQLSASDRIAFIGPGRVYIVRTRDDGLEEIRVHRWPMRAAGIRTMPDLYQR